MLGSFGASAAQSFGGIGVHGGGGGGAASGLPASTQINFLLTGSGGGGGTGGGGYVNCLGGGGGGAGAVVIGYFNAGDLVGKRLNVSVAPSAGQGSGQLPTGLPGYATTFGPVVAFGGSGGGAPAGNAQYPCYYCSGYPIGSNIGCYAGSGGGGHGYLPGYNPTYGFSNGSGIPYFNSCCGIVITYGGAYPGQGALSATLCSPCYGTCYATWAGSGGGAGGDSGFIYCAGCGICSCINGCNVSYGEGGYGWPGYNSKATCSPGAGGSGTSSCVYSETYGGAGNPGVVIVSVPSSTVLLNGNALVSSCNGNTIYTWCCTNPIGYIQF
jgi:hypothetical protein